MPVNNTDNQSTQLKINGVYQMDNTIIKVYQKNSIGRNISIEIGDEENFSTSMDAELIGNVIESSIFDNEYKFTFKGKSLELVTNSTDLTSGTYKLVRDYATKDYYREHFGDEKYLNGEYSGDYSSNKDKVYLLQIDDNHVQVSINKEASFFDVEFEIISSDTLKGNLLEEVYEIKFNGDTFTFKTIKGDNNKYDGTYTKSKKITMEDAINTFIR